MWRRVWRKIKRAKLKLAAFQLTNDISVKMQEHPKKKELFCILRTFQPEVCFFDSQELLLSLFFLARVYFPPFAIN